MENLLFIPNFVINVIKNHKIKIVLLFIINLFNSLYVGSLADLLVVGHCRPDRCAAGLSRRSVVF